MYEVTRCMYICMVCFRLLQFFKCSIDWLLATSQAAGQELHLDGIVNWHSGMTQAEAAAQEPKSRSKTSIPVGALAHHAWVRQWREKTGGTLAEGRQAWKALDTKTMWQFKIDYAAKETADRKPAAGGSGNKLKGASQGRLATSTNKKAGNGKDSGEKVTPQTRLKKAKAKPSPRSMKSAATVSLSKQGAKAKTKSMKRG